MAKNFASTGDLSEKKITFSEIGPDLYAFTAEGDPNTAIIVGDDGCLVFDAQNVADGPIARMQLPERISSGTHSTWAAGSSLPGWREDDRPGSTIGL